MASLQASCIRGWRPVSPQQPILEAFECTDNEYFRNLIWNFYNGLVQDISEHVMGHTDRLACLDI